jgi:1,4-dihydroxy-6-naphthoate synthase
MSLQLAISPCPNDTFVFHAWAHGLVPDAPAVQVSFADVDVTNSWAEQQTHDVLKVSYAALPWLLENYALLPAGGALGRGCGPLVLTRGGPMRGTVAVPGLRTTAYLLLRLWAASHDLGSIEVVPFEQIMPGVRDGTFDAGLVIHEARFTYQRYGLTAVADLGDWWEDWTGLPIPLGAVVARRSLDRTPITEAIRSSVRYAWADPEASRQFVRDHAQELEDAVIDAHIGLYVTEYTVDIGDEGLAAVRGLLTRAEAAGLVPPVRPELLL